METKFTPGEWFYQEESDAYTHIVRPEGQPGRIIHHGPQETDGEAEANARLISVAPKMFNSLIALNVAMDAYWNSSIKSDKLVKAIMKAQSESLKVLKKATQSTL